MNEKRFVLSMSHQYFEKKEKFHRMLNGYNLIRMRLERKKMGVTSGILHSKLCSKWNKNLSTHHRKQTNKQQPANWIYLARLPWQNKRFSNVFQLKSNNNRKKKKNKKTDKTTIQTQRSKWTVSNGGLMRSKLFACAIQNTTHRIRAINVRRGLLNRITYSLPNTHTYTNTAVHTDQTDNTNARAVVSSPHTSDGELNASLNYRHRLCDTPIKPNERTRGRKNSTTAYKLEKREWKTTVCGWLSWLRCMHVLATFVWNSSLSAAENTVSFTSIV